MKKIPKQEYTAEFRELAVKRIKEGLTAGAVSKELGVSDQTLRNRVKAAAVGKLNGAGAKVVTPERKWLTDSQMLTLIQSIHVELKGACGSPRMVKELRGRGFPASKERVERLMREDGIRARHKQRFKVTTDSRHTLPVAPNLLDRNFTPKAPNQVWTSDISVPLQAA